MPGRKRKVEESDEESENESEKESEQSGSGSGSGSESESSEPKPKPKKGRKKKIADSESEEEKDDKKKKGKAAKKAAKKPAPKKTSEKKPEEEVFNWWDMPEDELFHDGTVKWKTLKHNGPMFAPPYEPHGIPIKYEGKVFKMTEEEEEVATLYAVMRESQHYKNPVFRKNFFRSWKEVLDKRPEGATIKELPLCNFDAIWANYVKERDARKALPAAEKRKIREQTEKLLEPYRFVHWDGRKEKVANPRVEPPGLFRGRGKHPKLGCLKRRTHPEDVTINIGKLEDAPKAPEGHEWGQVISDNTVSWLAKWQDSITGDVKYTMLDRSGAQKQYKDRLKFEKARALKDKIDDVRADYTANFKSKNDVKKQMAVAMYFIDRLALRVGGEKGEDEADTVGCCSLRKEHITPCVRDGEDGNKEYYFHFDFLGKDSIRYVNDMVVSKEVHGLVVELLKGKDNRPIKANEVFDLVAPSDLNQKFKEIMDGLSAKVFRTYNASFLLDKIFYNDPVDNGLLEKEKMVYFTNANTKVAVLCNHQKTVSKGHETAKENLSGKINELKTTLGYLESALEKVETAKKAKKDEVFDKEKEKYWKLEDKIQQDWLEKYGTEEDKEKYQDVIDRRNGVRVKRKKKAESDSEDDRPVKKRKKPAGKKAAPKKSRKAKLDESSAEESDASSEKESSAEPMDVDKSDDEESKSGSGSESGSESEEDDKKKKKKPAKKPTKKPAGKKGRRRKVSESESDSD